MKKLQKQIDFLMKIDKLKDIFRQSLVLGNEKRRENDAEHSWHMAVCAVTLSEYVIFENINIEKVLKMILIHDIVEIIADDTPAFSVFNKEDKFIKELDAAEKLFGLLPEIQYKEFIKLWLEFENMETDEAKCANVFDRFQGFLQNLTSDGHTWKKWNVTREVVEKRLDPIIKYAPKLYTDFIQLEIEKYIEEGIIKR